MVFHSSDWLAIPFSLMWGGFSLFWEFGAAGGFAHGAHKSSDLFGLIFPLWGIPFVVIGQYMIWGRFLWTAWRKTRTFYGLTTKRVIVVSAGSTRKVVDGSLRRMESVSLTERKDRVGTIEFGPTEMQTWGMHKGRNQRQQIGIDLSKLVFSDLADARSLYRMIQAERDKTRASGSEWD